jgi:hypothetical protein
MVGRDMEEDRMNIEIGGCGLREHGWTKTSS